MKREFLQNLPVAGGPLSKEVIDAIMAENGRDIEAAKVSVQAYQTLLTEKESWEQTLRAQQEEHEAELRELKFSHSLDQAIREARGRNAKAISALLDLQTLRGDPEAIGQALEDLRGEAPYLFESGGSIPLFSQRTGAGCAMENEGPTTLAGALKERMNKERK